jgi:hypothetical protein
VEEVMNEEEMDSNYTFDRKVWEIVEDTRTDS